MGSVAETKTRGRSLRLDEDGCLATQDAVPGSGQGRMDVHLGRSGLQPGSDAQSDGAACLKPSWQRIHGHFEVVNLPAQRSSAPFSNSENIAGTISTMLFSSLLVRPEFLWSRVSQG